MTALIQFRGDWHHCVLCSVSSLTPTTVRRTLNIADNIVKIYIERVWWCHQERHNASLSWIRTCSQPWSILFFLSHRECTSDPWQQPRQLWLTLTLLPPPSQQRLTLSLISFLSVGADMGYFLLLFLHLCFQDMHNWNPVTHQFCVCSGH